MLNRAYHEGFGTLIGLAATQKPYLVQQKLASADAKVDEIQLLLKQALNYIVFIPFSTGVMTEFEHDLYAGNLSSSQLNARWWELAKKYQGMVPPSVRGEEFCDAASKTHINNDAAQYYDYALSTILLYQVHDHISKEILHQDPRSANYYGSKATGDYLLSMMKQGANTDWREMLKEKTGSELSAKAMLSYFQPLMNYLKKVNQGREYTLPAEFQG